MRIQCASYRRIRILIHNLISHIKTQIDDWPFLRAIKLQTCFRHIPFYSFEHRDCSLRNSGRERAFLSSRTRRGECSSSRRGTRALLPRRSRVWDAGGGALLTDSATTNGGREGGWGCAVAGARVFREKEKRGSSARVSPRRNRWLNRAVKQLARHGAAWRGATGEGEGVLLLLRIGDAGRGERGQDGVEGRIEEVRTSRGAGARDRAAPIRSSPLLPPRAFPYARAQHRARINCARIEPTLGGRWILR